MLKKFNGNNLFYNSLFKLLDDCFPGIKAAADKIEKMGAPWYQSSLPFVVAEEELIISHLGLIPVRLVIEDKLYIAAGFHGVCTAVQHRMKGHSRSLVEEALRYADKFFHFSMLFTDKPFLYERYGFSVVEQYNYEYLFSNDSVGLKLEELSMENIKHVSLIQYYCSNRLPVSRLFGEISTTLLYALNALRNIFYYCSEEQFIITYDIVEETIFIKDIIYMHPIAIELVLNAIPEKFNKVIFGFRPNFIRSEDLKPVPLKTDDTLMATSSFPEFGNEIRCPELLKF